MSKGRAQAVRFGKAWDFDSKRDQWLSKISGAAKRGKALRVAVIPLDYMVDLMAHGKVVTVVLQGVRFAFTTQMYESFGFGGRKMPETTKYVHINVVSQ